MGDRGGVLHTRHIHSGRQGRSTTHQAHTQWKTGEEYYTPGTYTVEDRGGVLRTRHIHSGRQGRSTTHQAHTQWRQVRSTTHHAHIQWKTGEEYYTPGTYTVEDRGGVLHTRHIHSGRQGRSTTHQAHTQWRQGRSTTHQAHTQWKIGEEYYIPGTFTVEDRGGVLHTRHIHSGR